MDIDRKQSASTSTSTSKDPQEFLTTLLSQTPSELHPSIESFQRLSERKLWHQLTDALIDFLRDQNSAPFQVQLWDGFIDVFKKRFDQLRLVEMATLVAQQYDDGQQALTFLRSVQSFVDTPTTPEAHLLATTESAHFSLLLGDIPAVQTSLASAGKVLDQLDNVPGIVHASFYRVSGDLHKSRAEYGEYYKNSLLYLACVPDIATDLSAEERTARAHDLGIAALMGETIYNFGELLMHPILEDLRTSKEYQWLHSLLYAFNSGNLGKFESLLPYLQQEPILSTSLEFLRPKICLMSLIQLVFTLASSERVSIPFSQIAGATQLPEQEVEYLVMKALALGLVRGDIDEVLQRARIHWVQPRVLGKEEIGELRDRLAGWEEKVRVVGEKSIKGNEVLLVQ